MSVVFAVWALFAGPRPDLEPSYRAFQSLAPLSITAKVSQEQTETYDVAMAQDGRAALWITRPDGSRLGAGLTGNTGWVFDPDSGFSQGVKASGKTVSERLASLAGRLPGPIAWLFEPASLRSGLAPAARAVGWRTKRVASAVEWRGIGAEGDIYLKIDARTHRLLAAKGVPSASSRAAFSFRPLESAALQNPGETPPVAPFAMPVFEDARARALALKATKAFSGLKHVSYTVTGGERSTKVWYSNGRYRQDDPRVHFGSYGNVFWIYDVERQKLYRGNTNLVQAQYLVARLDSRFDSVLLNLLRRVNPMRAVLPADGRTRWAGQATEAGQTVDVLETAVSGLQILASIRSDGLMTAVAAANTDSQGVKVSQNMLEYTYLQVGPRIEDKVFLPPDVPNTEPWSALRKK